MPNQAALTYLLLSPPDCNALNYSAYLKMDLEEVELPENHPWAVRKPVSSCGSALPEQCSNAQLQWERSRQVPAWTFSP